MSTTQPTNLYSQYTPPAGASGSHLKLSDGQTVKMRVVGYPVVSSKVFPGSEKPSTRYAWVVFNQDTQEAQSFEQGITFFKQIQALSMDPDWGDTATYDIKVTRNGKDTDTTYSVIPSSKAPLTKEQLEKVTTINLAALHEGSVPFADAISGKAPVAKDIVSDDLEPIPLEEIPFN